MGSIKSSLPFPTISAHRGAEKPRKMKTFIVMMILSLGVINCQRPWRRPTGTEVNQEIVDFAVGKLQEQEQWLFCTHSHRAANFKSQESRKAGTLYTFDLVCPTKSGEYARCEVKVSEKVWEKSREILPYSCVL